MNLLKNFLPPAKYDALMREKIDRLKRQAESVSWQVKVVTRTPHPKQRLFIDSPAKRKVIRAGRRGGKTTGIAIDAIEKFKEGRRVLYAAPTEDQVATFWFEIKQALNALCDAGVLYKNETSHIIEVPGTKNRIRCKTAWNADTLRGDFADYLILDEFQLMAEDTWGVVGAPMLLDNNGDAVFIYTPLSMNSKTRTKARDPKHAAKLYAKAEKDTSGRYAAFHFTSRDNPHISIEALNELTQDMTKAAIQQEIDAEDMIDVPGALWKQTRIDDLRRTEYPQLTRIVIGVDPPGGQITECGIVGAGLGADGHVYVLTDASLAGSPDTWSRAVIQTYDTWQADRVLGEKNFGGDMVEHTIRTAEGGRNVSYKNANASRGKAVRAEPIAAAYERGIVHHVGEFPMLESEMTGWIPNAGMLSPNRLDALVWAISELMPMGSQEMRGYADNPLFG
jgi:hypothetical protein